MDEDDRIMWWIVLLTNCLSLCASFAIFGWIWYRKLLSLLACRLVLYLTLSDFMTTIVILTAYITRDLCLPRAFVGMIGDVSNILWCAVLSAVIHSVLMSGGKKDIVKHEWKLHFFVWAISGVYAITPYFFKQYSEESVYCFLREKSYFRVLLYATFVVVSIFCLVVYYRAYNIIGANIPVVENIKWYPASLIFCFSFSTINLCLEYAGVSIPLALQILQYMMQGLYGTINAILFFSNKRITLNRKVLNSANMSRSNTGLWDGRCNTFFSDASGRLSSIGENSQFSEDFTTDQPKRNPEQNLILVIE